MNKKLFLIAASLILSLAGFHLKAQERMFGNLSKMEGVTSIYIGNTMLRAAGSTVKGIGSAGNFDTSKILSKLTGIEILTCSEPKYARNFSKALNQTLESMKDLEVAMEVNEESKDSSHVTIYTQGEPDSNIIKNLIIVVKSDNEPTIVAMHGNMTPEDLAAAIPNPSDEVTETP